MKKVTRFLTSLTIASILLLSSCTKNDDVIPDDSGNTNQSKFAGSWAVSENSKIYGASTYNASITDSSNTSYVFISYLYGFHKKIVASVNASTLTIPSQIIEGNQVTGSGTLENSKRLSFKYYVKITAKQTDTVSAVFTR